MGVPPSGVKLAARAPVRMSKILNGRAGCADSDQRSVWVYGQRRVGVISRRTLENGSHHVQVMNGVRAVADAESHERVNRVHEQPSHLPLVHLDRVPWSVLPTRLVVRPYTRRLCPRSHSTPASARRPFLSARHGAPSSCAP